MWEKLIVEANTKSLAFITPNCSSFLYSAWTKASCNSCLAENLCQWAWSVRGWSFLLECLPWLHSAQLLRKPLRQQHCFGDQISPLLLENSVIVTPFWLRQGSSWLFSLLGLFLESSDFAQTPLKVHTSGRGLVVKRSQVTRECLLFCFPPHLLRMLPVY